VTTRDDELLDVLAASLAPAPEAEPTWAEVSQLHRVVDSGWSGRHAPRTPLWRIRRPLTAAVAGFVVLGSASAAAALSGAVMPEPVRVAARAVGLPVESPELAGARAAVAGLREALGHNPRDLAVIRVRAQDVRDRLTRLSADDRSHLEDEADFLLADADNALAPPTAPLGSPPPQQSPAPSGAAPVAAPPSAAPAGDDHGESEPAAEQNRGQGSDDHPSGDDHSGSSAAPTGSDSSGQGPSGSSGDGDHTATTQHVDNSGQGSSDGGGGGSDGGSSHDGGSDGGGSSGSDGGGHSGPG